MNCQFDDLPIGSRVSYSDFKCLTCLESKDEYHEGTYTERTDEFHIVDLDVPVVCSCCGHHSYVLRIRCEQGQYFEILNEKVLVEAK